MSDTPERQNRQVRWAVIVTLGRVVVEAETADVARERQCRSLPRGRTAVLDI